MTDLIVVLQCDSEQAWARPEFESQHAVGGEQWLPVKPAVTPLMPPYEGKPYY